MPLAESVAALEREAAALEARRASREAEARAPATALEHALAAVEADGKAHEEQLRAFNAELLQLPQRPVVTLARGAAAAVSLGLFTFGAASGHLDLARVSVGLFAGVWVAFLAGALRGR